MWNIFNPAEAKAIIEKQRANAGIIEPKNLEEKALSFAGRDIYEKLIKGYTEKQWGTDCRNLPAFIIQRVPLRFTYNNNYYNDRYQGIPIGGYTTYVQKLLEGIDVRLNINYSDFIRKNPNISSKTIYTGITIWTKSLLMRSARRRKRQDKDLKYDIALIRPIYNSHIITPQLGLGYLSSFLKTKNYNALIIDALKKKLSNQQIYMGTSKNWFFSA